MIATEALDFDPTKLRKGVKHSGRVRRVIAECRRCELKYEIGDGGNRECPECGKIDRSRVIWRELSKDRWQKAKPGTCDVGVCTNEPTQRLYIAERIPGTPEVDVLVCDVHADIVVTEPLEP